jgi:hypothetical protein
MDSTQLDPARLALLTDTPANPNTEPRRYSHFWFRFLEIVPGTLVWGAILAPFILSFYFPLVITLFIIVFDVYWLQKSLITAANLWSGYQHLKKNLGTNWNQKLKELHLTSKSEMKKKNILDPDEIYHAIIFATYKEEEAILQSSIESILKTTFPLKRTILVLATEARDAENARLIAASLHKKFASKFMDFLVTEHPADLVGEVKGKGANVSWAAHELTKQIDALGITYDSVIVSTADADTQFHPNYLSCLSYYYATTQDRVHTAYQPIATFFNNIWSAPMLSRVMAFSTTFWQLAESIRSYRLITFSTHAMSLQTLVDINYWSTSVVNEDSRQFFRAYFHYKGNFRSIPLFMPVYMDAVYVKGVGKTLSNLYLQQQRWAYGVEHFPYIVLESIRQKKIPLMNRLVIIWRAFNGAFSWATSAFFISVVGWLPILLNNSFRNQVVASNFPQVASWLLTITWIGLFMSNFVSIKMLPPRPNKITHFYDYLPMIVQWVLVPICTIFFGAIPGLDSLSRLMFGKYLGFRVTEKKSLKTLSDA